MISSTAVSTRSAASPRYVYTRLDDLTRYVFREEVRSLPPVLDYCNCVVAAGLNGEVCTL